MPNYIAISYNGTSGLLFCSPFQKLQSQILSLQNTGQHPVAFKLKTTSPDVFYCNPFCGFLAVGQTATVQIGIKTRLAGDILSSSSSDRRPHAFMLFAYPLHTAAAGANGADDRPYVPAENPAAFWCRPVLARLLQATKMPVKLVWGQAAARPDDAGTYVRYDSVDGSCAGLDRHKFAPIAADDRPPSTLLLYEELDILPRAPISNGGRKTPGDGDHIPKPNAPRQHNSTHQHGRAVSHASNANDEPVYARISPVKVVVAPRDEGVQLSVEKENGRPPVNNGDSRRPRHYKKKSAGQLRNADLYDDLKTVPDERFEEVVIEALKSVGTGSVNKANTKTSGKSPTSASTEDVKSRYSSSASPGSDVLYESTTTVHLTYTETLECDRERDKPVHMFGDSQLDLTGCKGPEKKAKYPWHKDLKAGDLLTPLKPGRLKIYPNENDRSVDEYEN